MPLKETLQRLAAVPATPLPFLSAYVDLSPEREGGTRPFGGGSDDAPRRSWRRAEEAEARHARPGLTRMRALLGDRDRLLGVRGPERESFDADRHRILRYLEYGEFDPSSRGVAIFACAYEEFWEAVELPVPVDTQLVLDRTPLLYPLARLDDAYERYALCIADSQKARVYVVALGRAAHEETIGGPSINYKMTGGWSQKRIQERIGNAVANHVREIAQRLEELVFAEDLPRIVLGGDEIMQTEFERYLSPRAKERVVTFERLDIRLPKDEAICRSLEAVLEAERSEARDIARQALDLTLAGGLGAAGAEAVAHALYHGAVDTLVLDKDFDLPGWRCVEDLSLVGGGGEPEACPVGPGRAEPADLREVLTTLALQTGARVEFVEGSSDLTRMGGVAALLRWRPDELPPSRIAAAPDRQEAA